jgi:hypothetical protein
MTVALVMAGVETAKRSSAPCKEATVVAPVGGGGLGGGALANG